MAQHDMRGTFYVSSGFVGQPGRLTWEEVQDLQSKGNEIGGHTVNHLHLETLDEAEQARQICDDRDALMAHGVNVTSFAYPFDGYAPVTKSIVAKCGYNSARSEGGFGTCDESCRFAETIPAADPYSIRTAVPVATATRISSIEQQIIDAESNGGGWVPLVFHDVCDMCSDMAVTPSDFDSLLTWLQARAANGTTVKTITGVVGGSLRPIVTAAADVRSDAQLVNPSLELPTETAPATGPAVTSQCWDQSAFGDNTGEWARVTSAHSGAWAEQVTVSKYSTGDQKLVIRQDSGSCSPAVTPGQAYQVGGWYNSTAPTRIVAFYRLRSGAWKYWTASPQALGSDTWEQLQWTTPPMPAEATRISFGFQLAAEGTLMIDDYTLNRVKATGDAGMLAGLTLIGIFAGLVVLPTLAYLCWYSARNKRERRSNGGSRLATGHVS
ncbi:MAG: putative xylanase/chitin deacetylase [Micrococcaceae bacterium]|nr:putative xylanase/chitin deacetylase [Micrococcaceae bacterium]